MIFSLIYSFTREPNLKMIIKSYVTIAFFSQVDTKFVESLPKSAIENA